MFRVAPLGGNGVREDFVRVVWRFTKPVSGVFTRPIGLTRFGCVTYCLDLGTALNVAQYLDLSWLVRQNSGAGDVLD